MSYSFILFSPNSYIEIELMISIPKFRVFLFFFCIQVDGMDVLCVREATRFAADHCRSGKVS